MSGASMTSWGMHKTGKWGPQVRWNTEDQEWAYYKREAGEKHRRHQEWPGELCSERKFKEISLAIQDRLGHSYRCWRENRTAPWLVSPSFFSRRIVSHQKGWIKDGLFSQQQVCIVYYLRVLLGTEGGRGSRNLKAFMIRGEDEVQRSPGNVVGPPPRKKNY